MTTNLAPTLEYILAIKEDIRKAINSRGGVVTGGVPFEQWGSVLAGLAFDEDTIQNPKTKPVKATPAIPETPALPVVTPHNPTDLPSDFDIRTSGLTPIAVGFAYGSLQFDFTGAVGSVEEIVFDDGEGNKSGMVQNIFNQGPSTIHRQVIDITDEFYYLNTRYYSVGDISARGGPTEFYSIIEIVNSVDAYPSLIRMGGNNNYIAPAVRWSTDGIEIVRDNTLYFMPENGEATSEPNNWVIADSLVKNNSLYLLIMVAKASYEVNECLMLGIYITGKDFVEPVLPDYGPIHIMDCPKNQYARTKIVEETLSGSNLYSNGDGFKYLAVDLNAGWV